MNSVTGLMQRYLQRFLSQVSHLRPENIPTHLQPAFDYSRLRVLALLLPFHLLAQLFCLPLLTLCLWGTDHQACLPLAFAASVLVLWAYLHQAFLSSFSRYPIASCFAGKPARAAHQSRQWTYSYVSNAVCLLNGVLGVTWSIFLLQVFRGSAESSHLLAILVCVGLFAPALLCSLVNRAVEALIFPVIAVSFVTVVQRFHDAEPAPERALFLGLVVCCLFFLGVSRLCRHLLQRLLLDRLEQHERNEIMHMMTRGSDSHIGDWIWETDAEGCIQKPSEGFCALLGQAAESVNGTPLSDLLALPVLQPGRPLPWLDGQPVSAPLHLAHCLANRLAFRDLRIPVQVSKKTV